jgi:hypothetical protein
MALHHRRLNFVLKRVLTTHAKLHPHPFTLLPSIRRICHSPPIMSNFSDTQSSVSVSNCMFFISPVVAHTQTNRFWQAVLRCDESRMLYYVTFSVILSSAKQLAFMSKFGIQFRDCCDFPRFSSVF